MREVAVEWCDHLAAEAGDGATVGLPVPRLGEPHGGDHCPPPSSAAASAGEVHEPHHRRASPSNSARADNASTRPTSSASPTASRGRAASSPAARAAWSTAGRLGRHHDRLSPPARGRAGPSDRAALRGRDRNGRPLTREAIRNEASSSSWRGHETTANGAPAWRFYPRLAVAAGWHRAASRRKLHTVLAGACRSSRTFPASPTPAAVIEETLTPLSAFPLLGRPAKPGGSALRRDPSAGGTSSFVAPCCPSTGNPSNVYEGPDPLHSPSALPAGRRRCWPSK